MIEGDSVRIIKACSLRIEEYRVGRGSWGIDTTRIDLPVGTLLKYDGGRTPKGQQWGQVCFFTYTDSEGEEHTGRLPERDIFAGAPPVSDESYYEVKKND